MIKLYNIKFISHHFKKKKKMQKINNNNKKKLIPILKSNSRKRERGKNVKVVLFWPLGHGKMILCSAAAHTSIFNTASVLFFD